MKDRFIWDETYVSCDYVIDNQENKSIPIVDVVDLLNKQAQRIAELEVKNNNYKLRYELAGAEEEIKRLREENAKLKEQLGNSIVAPVNVGQEVYLINEFLETVLKGKVISISLGINEDNWFYCKYDGGLTYWHLFKDFNKDVFSTKAEAQKYLEERK